MFIVALFASAGGDKRRGNDIKKLAEKNGFRFHAESSEALINQLSKFRVFETNFEVEVENIIFKECDQMNLTVFDYCCEERGRVSSNQSVVMVSSDELKLPRFLLRREDYGDKLEAVLGKNDIDFDKNRAFSKKYFLSGDEEEVRKVFNRQLIDYLEKTDNLFIEGLGNEFILFVPGYLSPVKYLNEFIEEGEKIYSLMQS